MRRRWAEWASIGVLTIDRLLDEYDHLYIHGFDHLTPTEDGQILHYYPTPPKDSKYHNGEKEKVFVESLIEQGLVTRI